MNRRALLASAAATGATLLAGCNDGGPDYAYFVTVNNYRDDPNAVSVAAETDDGDVLFDESYDLDGRSAREHVPFDGDPASATVTVDDRDSETLAWPSADHCDDRNGGGKPGLVVSVGPTRENGTATVRTEWSCQSVER